MRKLALAAVALFISINCFSQITIPYTESFDDGLAQGWTQGILFGNSAFWQIGQPQHPLFSPLQSGPYALITGNNTPVTGSCYMQMPIIDYTDTTKEYYLSFYHKKTTGVCFGIPQFSLDTGTTWTNFSTSLYPFVSDNFSNSYPNPVGTTGSTPEHAIVSLKPLQGRPVLLIRFYFSTGTTPVQGGWMLDDVSIFNNDRNILANYIDTITPVSKFFNGFKAKCYSVLEQPLPSPITSFNKLYLSDDMIIDANDIQLDSFYTSGGTWVGTQSNLNTRNISMPAGLNAGVHYILCDYDVNNLITEFNENDNLMYRILKVDSTIIPPYSNDFEVNDNLYTTAASNAQSPVSWAWGEGKKLHNEGSHSGNHCWAINADDDITNEQYLFLPYINLLDNAGNEEISFWYKNTSSFSYKLDVGVGSYFTSLSSIPPCDDDEWDFFTLPLNNVDTSRYIKLRLSFSGNHQHGVAFDDIYVGTPKPDICLEGSKQERTTVSSTDSLVLKYKLYNASTATAGASVTKFYWSSDSIFDPGDIYIGAKNETALGTQAKELSSFSFLKPTNTAGTFFIFYSVDSGNNVNESRENNNFGYFKLIQTAPVSYPYINNFEANADGWHTSSSLLRNNFKYGTPANQAPPAYSGTKGWSFEQAGGFSKYSRSHLTSPAFDLSTAVNPVLEFRMVEAPFYLGATNFDQPFVNVSYSIDNGATWSILDTTSYSYNIWYTEAKFDFYSGYDHLHNNQLHTDCMMEVDEPKMPFFPYSGRDCNSASRMVLDITPLAGNRQIQFRINATIVDSTIDGFTIDDFILKERETDLRVRDNKNLYQGEISKEIAFNMEVINTGNYMSTPTDIKYYLSQDSLYSSNDIFLGSTTLPYILPEHWHHLALVFNYPNTSGLSTHNNLIYVIDSVNVVAETNETNNTGYWNNAQKSISAFPYLETFSDTTINGWFSGRDVLQSSGRLHRIRNVIPPNLSDSWTANFRMCSELTDNVGLPPFLIFESPVFNFMNYDSIGISFNLLCIGGNTMQNSNGGNLMYQTEDDSTWKLVSDQYSTAQNWYNSIYNLAYMWNKGWVGQSSGQTYRFVDASYLKGHLVKFKFQYYSNYHPLGLGVRWGMQLDNFRVDVGTIDYEATDLMEPFYYNQQTNTVSLTTHIRNNGPTRGEPTNTKFYLSSDLLLDPGDALVYSVQELPLENNETSNDLRTFNLPVATPNPAYILYTTDANEDLVESVENNNTGVFYSIVNSSETLPKTGDIKTYISGNILHISLNNTNSTFCRVDIYDLTGKLIQYLNLGNADFHKVTLDNLPAHCYFIKVQTNQHTRGLPYVPLH
jgi:hypothetical protein